MHNFLADMKALNLQNRTCALIENGSWAIQSGKLMKEALSGMKKMAILNDDISVTIQSSCGEKNAADVEALADALAADLAK